MRFAVLRRCFILKKTEFCFYNQESEENILKKLQSKAKELKDLGGTVPSQVKKLVDEKIEPKKEISGFKLVAGYSSDEDESSEEEVETNDAPRSILFPIQEKVDLKDLEVKEATVVESEPIDTKVFQRKRKIDIEIVNAQNKPKSFKMNDADEVNCKANNYTDYLGFKSGGIMFGKSEASPPQSKENAVDEEKEETKDRVNTVELEENKRTLSEKLAFLSEGHAAVSPVQTMLIQVEVSNKKNLLFVL